LELLFHELADSYTSEW